MYAVVKTGGKQYRVEAGATLIVEKLDGDPGSSVTFDRVLLVGDGDDVLVGTPTVPGASVTGTVLRAAQGPKIVVFKFKQKAKYRRRTGHRQHLTMVRIDSISADGRRATAEVPAEAPSKPRRVRKDATAAEPATERKTRPGRAEAKPTAKAKQAETAPEKGAAASRASEPTVKPASRARSRAASDDASAGESGASAQPPKARARRTARPKADETGKE